MRTEICGWRAGMLQRGLVILRNHKNIWSDVSDRKILPRVRCRVLFGDTRGRVWFGFENGAIGLYANGAYGVYDTKSGLPRGRVLGFTEDHRGDLWVSGEGGLSKYVSGHFVTVTKANGLPGNSVSGFLEDHHGQVWIAGIVGIFCVAPEELTKAVDSPSYRMKGLLVDPGDGLRAPPRQREAFPLETRTPDGRLWFTTSDGLAVIDPDHLHLNRTPSPVVIESIEVDDKPYGLEDPSLPPNPSSIQFRFSGLSFTVPEKVKSGTSWKVMTGTGMDPRPSDKQHTLTYRHAAIASLLRPPNNNGLWNQSGAAVNFSIGRAFYQTVWFAIICAAVACALLRTFYLLRMETCTRFPGNDEYPTRRKGANSPRVARHAPTECLRVDDSAPNDFRTACFHRPSSTGHERCT